MYSEIAMLYVNWSFRILYLSGSELVYRASPSFTYGSPVITLMQHQAKMLPRVAGVMPVMLLTEEAGDNGS